MSGHTEFTEWIAQNAEHVQHKGKQQKVKDVYFVGTGTGVHNSDEIVLEFEGGTCSMGFENVNLKDLRQRFEEWKTQQRRK